MKSNSLLKLITVSLISGLLLFGCAGTKGGGESEQTSGQDEDLEDIEALLGIKSEEQQGEQTSKQESGEKLNLLDSEMDRQQDDDASLTPAKEREYKNKIDNLQSQLDRKNEEIQRLRSQLNQKESEIQELARQPKQSSGQTSFAGGFGEVSGSEYEQRYNEGRQLFESRNYESAIEAFQSLLSSSASHKLSDNAQYWVGECHYMMDQYDAAILDFEKVFTFTNSNKKDDAQFKLGLCYLRKGERQKAIEEFDRLRADYPESEYINRIDPILAQF